MSVGVGVGVWVGVSSWEHISSKIDSAISSNPWNVELKYSSFELAIGRKALSCVEVVFNPTTISLVSYPL